MTIVGLTGDLSKCGNDFCTSRTTEKKLMSNPLRNAPASTRRMVSTGSIVPMQDIRWVMAPKLAMQAWIASSITPSCKHKHLLQHIVRGCFFFPPSTV
jgi:hypothetical protein